MALTIVEAAKLGGHGAGQAIVEIYARNSAYLRIQPMTDSLSIVDCDIDVGDKVKALAHRWTLAFIQDSYAYQCKSEESHQYDALEHQSAIHQAMPLRMQNVPRYAVVSICRPLLIARRQ